MKATILKQLQILTVAGALGFLSACANQPQPVAIQPVGPAPRETANSSHDGYLVVYSAWSIINEDKAPVDHHSRYNVISDNGKNREIINHVDRFDEGPIRVALAPGNYKVSARSAHSGKVMVPVIIQSQQTTYVYLDGQARPNADAAQQTKLVKLPNGQVVGWAVSSEK